MVPTTALVKGGVMATLKPNGPSFDETRSLVRAALQAIQPSGNGTYVWIDQTYSDMVIYSVETNSVTNQYAADYTIDKENKVTLGDPIPVVRKAVYEIVSFDVDLPDLSEIEFSGDVVCKDAILFKCGVYPDKGNFSLSQEEADEITIPALNQGVGSGIEVEHVKGTVFSKLLGKVTKAWRVGDFIYGTTEWPAEVAKLLKGKQPKFSISLNSVTKLPIEVSIVKNPRVVEAGVLTKFNKDSDDAPTERKGVVMSFFGTLAEKLGLTKAEVESGVKAEFSQITDPLEAKITALEAENAALKQGQSTFTAAQSATTATQIVEGFLLKGKLTPAEKDAAIAAFSSALDADGGVQFAEGKQSFGGVTSALLATYEARPTIPQFGAGFSVVPGESEGFKPQSASEVYANRQGGKK
jgi:hypothetical protein